MAVDQIVVRDDFPASVVCDVLQVSRSGFYSWRSCERSQRSRRDDELKPVIEEIFWHHKRRYGARRIAAELRRRDISCSVSRAARLMKTLELQAIQPKSFTPRTTQSRHRLGYNENLLEGRQSPAGMNQVWVGDITYIPLSGPSGTSKFGYLAVLMDLYSRRVVGWEYGRFMDESLVLGALRRAIQDRQPAVGLIHHSDRGGQYAARDYRAVLRRAGMLQSMSATADCYDNATMESCFGSLKTELELTSYSGHPEALRELTDFVNYYNNERLHSSLGYVPPAEYEATSTP
eukprot:TRINITY_DN12098_c1_g1_i2.p1 TRINITY_DN12098_c1_g1~~TRINITY_DN12098_c1_g1_i2.p1  ORF type:complete len:290 (-),score=23.94 TRINITY_DN12098_c1_g1_i2:168-1037(-)